MLSNKEKPSCGWNSCYLVNHSQATLNSNFWITFPSIALNFHKMPIRCALDRNDHFREQETEIQRISQLWSFSLSPGSSGSTLNSLSVLPSSTPSAFAKWASSVRHMLRKQKRSTSDPCFIPETENKAWRLRMRSGRNWVVLTGVWCRRLCVWDWKEDREPKGLHFLI